jgi:glyoxylase-like metal-dependent hydrolase (beta-lactamase superfamily II)
MRISDHVWWMPPAKPDRPSLCAVVGERWTLMLDAGSSRAHTRSFLDELPAEPRAVVLTHSHWDHVFGAVEIGGTVIAHRLTVPKLDELRARDWSDDGLAGYRYADDIKEELPSPRVVEIAPVDLVFDEGIDLDLGGVTVRVRHVGGAHADDSCVMFVEPDGVLFIGDALCDEVDERLRAAIFGFGATHHVEGHHDEVTSRQELEALLDSEA